MTPKKTKVDGETLYITEGDLLLDEEQLEQHTLASREPPRVREGLIGILQRGKVVRWKPGAILSYAVLEKSFPVAGQYDTVVGAMKQATAAWERTCGVKFEHRPELDGATPGTPSTALFTVRWVDTGGQLIAAAFFPNDPKNRRRVIIDPSYFQPTGFDAIGVLRHELGHVLGFRHEHIRSGAPAVCPDESPEGTIDLTRYDPRSVMHYFCGGVGSRTLEITQLDRDGAQRIYGPPLAEIEFAE